MRKAGAARRSGKHQTRAIADGPSTRKSLDDSEIDQVFADNEDYLDDMIWIYEENLRIEMCMPTLERSYEGARMAFDVDLVDLSILTNFNIGRAHTAVLSKEPTRLVQVLHDDPVWSFLHYVPTRYASSELIAKATDCVWSLVPRCHPGSVTYD
jgi:hypothetical protein